MCENQRRRRGAAEDLLDLRRVTGGRGRGEDFVDADGPALGVLAVVIVAVALLGLVAIAVHGITLLGDSWLNPTLTQLLARRFARKGADKVAINTGAIRRPVTTAVQGSTLANRPLLSV